MKTDKETFEKLEQLLKEYENEVEKLKKDGVLKETTAKTYLNHSKNFVRWVEDDFEPGKTNRDYP